MVNKEQQKRLEQKLDETAELWKSMLSEGNEAAAQACKIQIWELVFELYDREDQADASGRKATAVLDVMKEALAKYTPEAGAFSRYFSYLLKRREIDAYRYDERHAPGGDSLDRPISEEGGLTLGDTLTANPETEPEAAIDVDGLFAELTSRILNLSARQGRAGNETRRMWYRIFYTEDMTCAMKEHVFRFVHPRDIFEAMETDYLDYYMTAVCRDEQAVMDTPLKRCCDVIPESTDTQEIPFPFPAGVSLAYLKACRGISASGAARSNHLKEYRREKSAIYSL